MLVWPAWYFPQPVAKTIHRAAHRDLAMSRPTEERFTDKERHITREWLLKVCYQVLHIDTLGDRNTGSWSASRKVTPWRLALGSLDMGSEHG